MPNRISIVGRKFARLTVLKELPTTRQPNGSLIHWSRCLCDCGKMKDIRDASLQHGNTTSCGCAQKEAARKANGTHFHSRSGAYESWLEMHKRCTNSKCAAYEDYGARGITVCERWKSFDLFLADMGERPEGKMIERINNCGNYDPINCKWADRTEQNRNKRSNRVFTFQGVTACLSELCDVFEQPYERVQARITALGWTIEDAMTKPCKRDRVRLT